MTTKKRTAPEPVQSLPGAVLMYPVWHPIVGQPRALEEHVGWVRVDLIGVTPPWWLGEPGLGRIDPERREWR